MYALNSFLTGSERSENTLAFSQLTSVGKILHYKGFPVPTIFLTDWCDNLRKQGGQLLMNKDSLVWKLFLIIPGVDDAGLVSMCGFRSLDATHWFLLMPTLKHPANTTLGRPSNNQEADQDASRSTPATPSPPRPPPHSQPPHSPSVSVSPQPSTSISGRAPSGS